MISSDEDEQPCSDATGDLDESNDPPQAKQPATSSQCLEVASFVD